jgi:hypothetical protein
MTQEDKELLLKDLCARLLYGVNGLAYIVGEPCNTNTNIVGIINESIVTNYESPMLELIDLDSKDITIKPYLRPMSSISSLISAKEWSSLSGIDLIDWYNANHIDYRGLIEKSLALEAPKDMYK